MKSTKVTIACSKTKDGSIQKDIFMDMVVVQGLLAGKLGNLLDLAKFLMLAHDAETITVSQNRPLAQWPWVTKTFFHSNIPLIQSKVGIGFTWSH